MPTIVAYVHAYVPEHNAGAETTLHDILKSLVLEGWEAKVVVKAQKLNPYSNTAPELPEYVIDGVHVIPSTSKGTIVNYIAGADVTISHLECSERTHLLSKAYKVPSIHLVHNTHPLTVQWSASADALIFNTEWIRNDEAFKSWTGPAMVLNPPVNPSEYVTARGKSVSDRPKAVTLVNLWEDKGARVFYELARRFPNVPFLGVKGGYGEQVIEDLPNVTVMEHTPDVKSFYGQTKVLLMPSKYESFGRVGVEGMASGIPTIAHPTPGLQESLGEAGTFVDRADLDAWENALRDILKPAKYGKMSKLALARSEALHKLTEAQKDTLKVFIPELIRVKRGN
jgi:glycosyltransferase involved in cell wall biosynthesis